jgi:hypothetical protein
MNRTRVRIAILALPLATLGVGLGCLGQADRTYFDDLVDGSADGTTVGVDARSVPDASMSDVPVVMGDDSTDSPDVVIARDAPDAPLDDAAMDAGLDSASVRDSAPVEAGCGPTNTVTNCGQCGAACDTTHSTPSACTGGACQYTCNAGWGDCQPAPPDTNGCETPLTTALNCTACGVACDTVHSNGAACSGTGCLYTGCANGWSDCNAAAPNANGCECQSPGCCEAGACEPQHNNGIGNTYYDCTPVGVFTSSLALQACIAYTDAASECVGYPCADPDSGPIICSSGALNKFCMCWSYAGSNIGLVDNAGENPGTNGRNCFCPSAAVGDTPWN